MNSKELRTLKASEIEVRQQGKPDSKGNVNFLLYMDARVARRLLNEKFGIFGWQSEYVVIDDRLFVKLSVKDPETGQWVTKMETGSESNIEKEKGQVSDAMKRAVVTLGWDELYSAPDIKMPDDGYGNKGYKVTDIAYTDGRKICKLVIANKFGKEAFRWEDKSKAASDNKNVRILTDYCRQVKKRLIGENKPVTGLNGFYLHYEPVVRTWESTVNPEKLWMEWTSR